MSDYRHISDALVFLSIEGDTLIARVVEKQCAAALSQSWNANKNARLRCVEDNRFHLHYLTASILAGNSRIFAEYCGWVKIVLEKRGIPATHLEENLKHWRDLLLASAPEGIADVIAGFIDVALENLSGYPEDPAAIVTKEKNVLVTEFIERLLAFDSEGAIRLIESKAADADNVLDLFVNVLQPAQREIGRLWQVNSISIAVEHYATSITQRILHRLSHLVPPRRHRNARMIGVCGEGEHHCIGLEMICSLCRLDGWEAHFVGANTPTASAVSLCRELQPDIIAVSMTTLIALQSTRTLIAKLKEALPGTVIIAGGYAASLGADLWKSFGADAYAPDAISALADLDRMLAKLRPEQNL